MIIGELLLCFRHHVSVNDICHLDIIGVITLIINDIILLHYIY